MPQPTSLPETPMLVACLCAQWCGTCNDYRSLFDALALKFPQVRLLWIDVEDQSDVVDPVEVEDFPTILIASREHPLFFGTVLPHIQTLQRLIEAHWGGDSKALTENADVQTLVDRLWRLEADSALLRP
ncbi:MAG: thioredoxin family protein [Rhodoferax sp.]|nr:thioredoxin family protein [Rhodoferax sp.]